MRSNNSPENESDLNRDQIDDLEQTIQFTEEDLKKLRRPNRQPLDGDYFTQSDYNNEWEQESDASLPDDEAEVTFDDNLENENDYLTGNAEDSSRYNERLAIDQDFSSNLQDEDDEDAENAYDASLGRDIDWELERPEKDSFNYSSDYDDQLTDSVNKEEDTLSEKQDAIADTNDFVLPDDTENPFKYHSIKDQLKRSLEEEKEKEAHIKEANKKPSIFQRMFTNSDEKYSTRQLDALDDYNQFDSSNDSETDSDYKKAESFEAEQTNDDHSVETLTDTRDSESQSEEEFDETLKSPEIKSASIDTFDVIPSETSDVDDVSDDLSDNTLEIPLNEDQELAQAIDDEIDYMNSSEMTPEEEEFDPAVDSSQNEEDLQMDFSEVSHDFTDDYDEDYKNEDSQFEDEVVEEKESKENFGSKVFSAVGNLFKTNKDKKVKADTSLQQDGELEDTSEVVLGDDELPTSSTSDEEDMDTAESDSISETEGSESTDESLKIIENESINFRTGKRKKASKKKKRKNKSKTVPKEESSELKADPITEQISDEEKVENNVVKREESIDEDTSVGVDTHDTADKEEQTSETDNHSSENSEKDLEEQAAILSEKVSQATASYTEPLITDQSLNDVQVQDDLRVEEEIEDTSSTRFAQGAAWLSAGNIISRIIGALYVIPWATFLGADYTTANTLYSVGYKPYSLFLAIATAGFPSAIAKQMAFYHSKKEYRVADKLFKYSMLIMFATGIISAALLYFGAPFLAANSATDTPDAAVVVIRTLAPALLILPAMSLLRGYFQGFDNMMPTAVSQIIEQIARVAYLLIATYAIMQLISGDVTEAVAHSTFAAFIGAVAALIFLLIIYLRKLPVIKTLIKQSEDKIELDFMQSVKIMVMDSIPFIILGSGIIIAQIIDTYSFRQIIQATSTMLLSDISELYGVLSLDVDKLVMIIISLAVAIASSAVPAVTRMFAKRDYPGTSRLIQNIVTIFSFVMLPAAVGLASIANNMYFFFYPQGSEQGPSVLILGAYLSIVLGAYTILSTILQSMNFRRIAVRFLLIGLVIKLILQFPFVAFLQTNGAQLATLVAFTFTSVFMWVKIHKTILIDYKDMAHDLVIIVVSTVLMGISTSLWNTVLDAMFGPVGRLLTFVKIMIVVIIGMFIYLGIMAVFGKLNILLGNRYKYLQDKLQVFY